MGPFKRNDIVDAKFIFLDGATNEPIDVNNPTYRIVHYSNMVEIEDVAQTALEKIVGRTGEYLASWLIPGTATENENYFIYASGTHPIDLTNTLLEEIFRIVPIEYFTGSSNGLQISFIKP